MVVPVLFRHRARRRATRRDRNDFNKLIWHLASPKWDFDDATYDRSAPSFANPDHVAVVIHNYRWRLGLVQGEPQYDALEQRLATGPTIAVPTITMEGDANGAPHPESLGLREEIHGQVCAPEHRRRDRTQPSARSAKSVRRCGDRCRAYGVIGLVVKRLADRACHRIQVAGVDGRHAAR